MNIYELVPYTDADHDNYIKCQMDAFEKYILEFFGVCDMAIMENHLKQLKPNLLKIAVKNQTAGYVYYKEEDTKIIVDVFTLFPEYRNNGLGSLILQDFIKKANESNKPIFWILLRVILQRIFMKKMALSLWTKISLTTF